MSEITSNMCIYRSEHLNLSVSLSLKFCLSNMRFRGTSTRPRKCFTSLWSQTSTLTYLSSASEMSSAPAPTDRLIPRNALPRAVTGRDYSMPSGSWFVASIYVACSSPLQHWIYRAATTIRTTWQTSLLCIRRRYWDGTHATPLQAIVRSVKDMA